MNLEKFLEKDLLYVYTRRMTYQKTRLYYYSFAKGVLGYKLKTHVDRYKDGNMFNYHDKKEEDFFSKYLLKSFLNEKFVAKNLKNIESQIKNDFSKYLSFVKSLPKKTSKLSNKKICSILNEFYRKETIVGKPFWILFGNVEDVLIEVTRQLLMRDGLSELEANNILDKLSEPIKLVPIDMEKISLLNVALGKINLEKHYKEFCYMPMYDIDYDPESLKYFQDRLKKINKKNAPKEIKNIEEKYAKRYKEYLGIIKRFNGKKHILYLLKFFAAYGYLKDFKPYVRDKGSLCIRPVFEEVAKRLGITLSEALFLNEKEIPNLLFGKIKLPDLKQRINNSAYICSNGGIYLFTDQKSLKKIDSALTQKEKTVELKGVGVSPGIAKGSISVILSNNDFSKFKQGEILVTSATRPDFVPLMRKASAIITDEGGILSHAAIVSRELKKPCVVGTKNATRVLKDGYLVEVDANKGIVKIIK